MTVTSLISNDAQLFLQELGRARSQQLNRLISLGNERWVVSGIDGLYRHYKEITEPGSRSTSAGLRIQALEANDSRLTGIQQSGRPLDELLWNCAFQLSDGKLLPGCRRDDVIRLQRWPNFSRLTRTPNSLKITALLTSRATSLVLASRILHISEDELYQFCSAAHYAGYSTAVNRADVVQLADHNSSPRFTIVQKLLKQLKLRPQAISA
ncbi:hypothetical protein [Parathalassolituus penaei]|uniref:Uncharacterized protein n=1 Tax=Parathalassolituus penaei TaxID=2997323 RepID=A0A9X3EF38_9GAMM|nr:hypothetical protein [Parathalassolituus penaei]MCY0965599.1 hypothetical protein [Parathalassolituus penaei]